MELLDILYIVLIIFTVIIWSLLSIVLYRILKILDIMMEILAIYNKVKAIAHMYWQIPEFAVEYIKNKIFWRK